jgi:hypothetical protein
MIMAQLEKRFAKKWLKCQCCEEQIRSLESYFQVVEESGSDRKGERYCKGCLSYAIANNEDITSDEGDGDDGIRSRETYAAYQAAGCTNEYWGDRDAGYAN